MNLERDLPDALRPLAGDPVADAARVLAALPPGPPPGAPPRPAPRPWLPWLLLGLGLGVGTVIGRATAPTTAAPASDPKASAPKPDATDVKEPSRDAKDKADSTSIGMSPNAWPMAMERYAKKLLVMAFGPVEIDEPGVGRQKLDPGEFSTELATSFKTTKGQVGIWVGANDIGVRIDYDTAVRVEADRITLDFGRIYVNTGNRDGRTRVVCGGIQIAFDDAAGVVTRAPSGVEVLGLSGTIDVMSPIDNARVAANESVTIDPDRGPRPKVAVPFTPTATSWMTKMLEQSQDRKELYDRVREVFAAYEQGTFRNEARRELQRLGSRCVMLLADSIDRNLRADPAYCRDACELITTILDWPNAQYALPVLLLDDEELRTLIFHAIREKTGTDGGTDEEFWRRAARDRRRVAVERWRDELSR